MTDPRVEKLVDEISDKIGMNREQINGLLEEQTGVSIEEITWNQVKAAGGMLEDFGIDVSEIEKEIDVEEEEIEEKEVEEEKEPEEVPRGMSEREVRKVVEDELSGVKEDIVSEISGDIKKVISQAGGEGGEGEGNPGQGSVAAALAQRFLAPQDPTAELKNEVFAKALGAMVDRFSKPSLGDYFERYLGMRMAKEPKGATEDLVEMGEEMEEMETFGKEKKKSEEE